MSHLLPSEKLEEQLPKLLPGVLALYRKHAETFHVSKVHARVLWPVQSLVHCPISEDPSQTGRCRHPAESSPESFSDSVVDGVNSKNKQLVILPAK